jgi:hypothetical protein
MMRYGGHGIKRMDSQTGANHNVGKHLANVMIGHDDSIYRGKGGRGGRVGMVGDLGSMEGLGKSGASNLTAR